MIPDISGSSSDGEIKEDVTIPAVGADKDVKFRISAQDSEGNTAYNNGAQTISVKAS
jgi:hypothetical protein